MAVAIVSDLRSINKDPNGFVFEVDLSFFGNDVPGNFMNYGTINITVASTATAAAIGTTIRSAVQTIATGLGFTVANGDTFVPSFQRI